MQYCIGNGFDELLDLQQGTSIGFLVQSSEAEEKESQGD
jgi:hypothetical protein